MSVVTPKLHGAEEDDELRKMILHGTLRRKSGSILGFAMCTMVAWEMHLRNVQNMVGLASMKKKGTTTTHRDYTVVISLMNHLRRDLM